MLQQLQADDAVVVGVADRERLRGVRLPHVDAERGRVADVRLAQVETRVLDAQPEVAREQRERAFARADVEQALPGAQLGGP
jgi:hypothetical protein